MKSFQRLRRRLNGLPTRLGYLQRRLVHDDAGGVLLLTAFAMVAVCGFGALAIDAGVMMAKQQQAQSAADAGALAGATNLPSGAQTAANTAIQYATTDDATSTFTATADTTAQTVSVTGQEQMSLWLARVLGFKTGSVSAHAMAQMGTLVAGTGMVPIGVPDQPFSYGEEVSLSQGAGDGTSGNYYFLDLSGNGANGLESDLEYGYSSRLSLGQQVATETGVMVGSVKTAIDYRLGASSNLATCSSFQTATADCSRVMYLPVVNNFDINGTKNVTIVGFAAFYVDGFDNAGGHESISGRFIRMVKSGELGSGTDYGLETVKLSH